MKKLLTLVACLLCLGMTTQARHNDTDCNSCHKRTCGTCVKKDDCGATCKRDVQVESRDGYIDCPYQKTITLNRRVPVTQTREKITETCVCPAPKVGYTEWSKACCPNKNCGHCEWCRCNGGCKAKEVTVTGDVEEGKKEDVSAPRKEAKAKKERKGFFSRNKAA